ncbi:hypothetical protein DO021_20970 [Desulfobacter hydrogenophilus]|uniref:Uncharacterized protein n=1 Tax=Desulfobacter hydrogenophilus TaxID=2291 RepID=A0A328F9L7_9BACT|nr:hypothetical protein DO021_20970 [Desulfobacter hydrogenophilus]
MKNYFPCKVLKKNKKKCLTAVSDSGIFRRSSRGDKAKRFSSGSFFLQGLIFENWSVKKKRAGQ